jgi:hypothetical protein
MDHKSNSPIRNEGARFSEFDEQEYFVNEGKQFDVFFSFWT